MVTTKKPNRMIFQPTELVSSLIKEFQTARPAFTIGDFINSCIENSFSPYHDALRTETTRILRKLTDGDEIHQEELQTSLAHAVKALRDHPINTHQTLEKILIHFQTSYGKALRYDYILFIDSYQDAELRRLNEILATLDANYNMGKRELGERANDIFRHWDALHAYPEIYHMLSTIITCEQIYIPLDPFTVLNFIMQLDLEMIDHAAPKKTDPYPVHVTLEQKIHGLQYAIGVYQCDNGYAVLSGDSRYEHMPTEFRQYEQEWTNLASYKTPNNEETLQKLLELEEHGKVLLKQIHRTNKK